MVNNLQHEHLHDEVIGRQALDDVGGNLDHDDPNGDGVPYDSLMSRPAQKE